MNRYIATFYSHFGAMSYCKALRERDIAAKPAPVPRSVSSSCGTCVGYEHGSFIDLDGCELDAIFLSANNAFERVLKK
jgi:hypothetical protein